MLSTEQVVKWLSSVVQLMLIEPIEYSSLVLKTLQLLGTGNDEKTREDSDRNRNYDGVSTVFLSFFSTTTIITNSSCV